MEFQSILVKNISPQATETELFELFSQFGQVKDLEFPQTKYPETPKYAYVSYQEAQQAELAKSQAEGTKLHNLAIKVESSLRTNYTKINQLVDSVYHFAVEHASKFTPITTLSAEESFHRIRQYVKTYHPFSTPKLMHHFRCELEIESVTEIAADTDKLEEYIQKVESLA